MKLKSQANLQITVAPVANWYEIIIIFKFMDPEEQLEKLLEVFYDEKLEPKKEAAKEILRLSTEQ